MINPLTEACDSPETAKVKNGGSRHREKTLAKEEASASGRGRRRRVAAVHVVAAGWTSGSCRLSHWRLLSRRLDVTWFVPEEENATAAADKRKKKKQQRLQAEKGCCWF